MQQQTHNGGDDGAPIHIRLQQKKSASSLRAGWLIKHVTYLGLKPGFQIY